MSSNSKELKAERRIELLFSKFAAFYGHVWRKPLSDERFLNFAKKEWEEALKNYSDVVIKKAIDECLSFHQLPPTLPQMLVSCRAIQKRFVVVPKEDFVPGNKEVAMTHIKQCLAMLKK